ncbi:ATP synthase protein I [Haloactinospora alba]|uniref:ATP synthase protein I n=1 Tax=Haloactinospora alba TaxID=405555 RepID=A0A543NL91_9ACTN|nr:hypothetical protein [Haloactinospora alba]TQN32613.1 ATP synthase protein I [Haloactinospora alba]
MQEHDARIIRGAAIPTAVAGTVATIVAAFTAGVAGVAGVVAGTALILGFFAVSAVVIAWTGERNPQLMLPVAFLVYTTKVGILAIALVLFKGTAVLNGTAFALTSLACVIVWLAGQAVANVRVKRPYVEPARSTPEAGPALEEER